MSHLVLVEAVWVLTSVYGLAAPDVAAAVEILVSRKNLSVQDADGLARRCGSTNESSP